MGLKINLACVEDGIIAMGFRKMASFVKSINTDTHSYYVPLSRRSMWNNLRAKQFEAHHQPFVTQVAEQLAAADIVGFSSMSDYASFVKDLIREVRRINPRAYIVWGGAHGIMAPEDAIEHADAVCTGEGELAFQTFIERFRDQADFLETRNFWFRHQGDVRRNNFLPLMTNEDMSALPLLEYANGEEIIFERGKGFRPVTARHYLLFNSLAYNTIWTIGCPFHCTYCGNTKFIENDYNYRRLRYSSLDYVMRELELARRRHPHLTTIIFHDDSFMALPVEVLRDFAQEYQRRIGIPFVITGVIPNYVRDDKMDILMRAGMHRVRMGIQSGSARILEFYKRPSPPPKIMAATQVLNKYTPYMIPPVYDIIMDNPIETRQDVVDTLRLLYDMPRPYTLNIVSLRLIANTEMVHQFAEMNISHHDMVPDYLSLAPTWANAMVYLITVIRPPRAVFEWCLRYVQPMSAEQKMYPMLNYVFRFFWLTKRAIFHLSHMDFVQLPGSIGFFLWKLGITAFWKKYCVRKYTPAAAPISDSSLPILSD